MEISKPDDLGYIANLGLTLTEAKQLLARVQREICTAQAREHAVRRPVCPCRDGVCRVKNYRDHGVATLFGQVTLRLPRFRCAACGRIETGIEWPSHCRSTPELGRLRAHLSALMTYRVSADLLEHMFPVDAGIDPGTLRRHTQPEIDRAVAKALDGLTCAEQVFDRPERVAGKLRRAPPRRVESRDRDHRRDSQSPGEPPDEQRSANALVTARRRPTASGSVCSL